MGIALMATQTPQSRLCVSFVIPAMNEATMIVGALDSLRHLQLQGGLTVTEVIMVDSGSTDSTPEIARAAGCIVIPATAGNVSASRNLGAARATGNILAFVDADCELPKTWLTRVAAELNDSNVVGAGMQMAAPESDAPWVERTWHQLAHHSLQNGASRNADWLATFNLAVRADVFRRIGGFDEALTTCEDVDLGYRLSAEGTLRFIPRERVIHHGKSKSLREFFRREAWRARGGWRLLRYHRNSLRELVSCLIPFVVTGSLLAAFVSVRWIGASAMVGIIPLLILVLRRRPTLQQLPAAMTLQAVYFAARCRRMLRPAVRVERASDAGSAHNSSSDPAAVVEQTVSPS